MVPSNHNHPTSSMQSAVSSLLPHNNNEPQSQSQSLPLSPPPPPTTTTTTTPLPMPVVIDRKSTESCCGDVDTGTTSTGSSTDTNTKTKTTPTTTLGMDPMGTVVAVEEPIAVKTSSTTTPATGSASDTATATATAATETETTTPTTTTTQMPPNSSPSRSKIRSTTGSGSTSTSSTSSSNNHHRRTTVGRRKRRVIVIGSGMAGLCAARELQQRGYSILIVEAQDRIGGRLKSYDMHLSNTTTATTTTTTTNTNGEDRRITAKDTTTTATATTTATNTKTKSTGKRGINNHNNYNDTHNVNTNTTNNNNQHTKNNGHTKVGIKNTTNNNNNNTKVKARATNNNNNKKHHDTPLTVPIDIGGALIHGIIDNPVHTMVHSHMQIPTHTLSDCLLLSNNGWPIDVQHDKHISLLFNDCLSETFTRIEHINNHHHHHQSLLLPTTIAAATKTTTATTALPSSKTLSFGDLFDQVCQERNVNTNTPLFRWYQANLELSSGTTFQNLGYTWNDDEPYGYDGDHVAIQSSWKSVCTTLGGTLYVLYNSPVTKIQVVYPDPEVLRATTATCTTTTTDSCSVQQQMKQNDNVQKSDHPTKHRKVNQHPRTTTTLPKNTTKVPPPQRTSKRLRGIDVGIQDVRRRSDRSNKGQISQMNIVVPTSNILRRVGTKRSHNGVSVSSTLDASNKKSSLLPKDIKTMVRITLQSGITLEADAVVCTIPLGVLKDGSVTFDPPLPIPKQIAIQQLGTGLFNKCALTFTKQFWQNSDFLGMVGDPHHSYLILNATKYTNQPVLLFLYGGAFAKEVEEWTDHDVVDDCLSTLRRICGRECVTIPVDYHVTRWGKEPYSRMSFTYVPPGVNGIPEFKAMSQPIYDHTGKVPVVMFAGEHTTPYHPSTIHGAYLSGIREAYRYDCALEPEANNFLEFTEENVYERTFMIKRKTKDPPIGNDSTMTNGKSVQMVDVPSATIEQQPDSNIPSTETAAHNPIQSYARRRLRRGGNSTGGSGNNSTAVTNNDVNGTMKLRHRSKTYFTLDMSESGNKKRGTVPAIALSTAPVCGTDKPSEAHPTSTATSPIPARRSQRNNGTATENFKATPVLTPGLAVSLHNGTAVENKVTRPPVATLSPSRRSQRTTISTNSPQPNGKVVSYPLSDHNLTSSSSMKHMTTAPDEFEDLIAIAAASQRQRRTNENRILLRSLESYGPNYDFIYNTVLPIYTSDNNNNNNKSVATAIGSKDVVSFTDCQHLEQHCVKLLRKKERSNAQREAAVLHYYKSWIADTMAPSSSTVTQKTTTVATTTNNNGIRKTTKTYVFAVPPTSGTTTTVSNSIPTTTRSGRTSNRPATMLL